MKEKRIIADLLSDTLCYSDCNACDGTCCDECFEGSGYCVSDDYLVKVAEMIIKKLDEIRSKP